MFSEPTSLVIIVENNNKVDTQYNGVWMSLRDGVDALVPYDVSEAFGRRELVALLKLLNFVPFDNRGDMEEEWHDVQTAWDEIDLIKLADTIGMNQRITITLKHGVKVIIALHKRCYGEYDLLNLEDLEVNL